MKAISILHTEASNGWGGQEIRILNEMLGLKGRDYRVLLATPPETTIYRKAGAHGVRTFPVSMDGAHFLSGVIRLLSIIRKHKISLINTHSSRDSWIGTIAGRLAGVRVIRTRHISSQLNTSPFTKLLYRRLCHGVVTTARFIRDQIVEELGVAPERVFSIPTGIDINRFRNANGTEMRRELAIPERNVVIGIAAVLRSWKGHLELLEALHLAVKGRSGVNLVIAGEGPRRRVIEKKIAELGLQEHVRMTGHREDIERIIQAFDIAVLSSYASEGIPQFLLQAMAAGKPLIGTRVGGIPEVIEDGVNGLLVPPRECDPMRKALTLLLDDPEKRRLMGQAGYERAATEHTASVMLDRMETVYSILGFN